MAKGGYVGVSGSARKIKKGYVGVPTQKDALKFLEYIESTGTQYIDTGWKFGTVNYPNVSLEADVVITATSGTRITGVGAYTSFYYGVGVFGNGWACGNGYGDVNVSNSSYTIGARVKINYSLQTPLFTVEDKSNGNIIANSSFTPQTPQHSAVPFLLSAFKQSNTGAITPHAERIYSFKIFENENLVRDFVPCQNASGEIGMYDNVHDVFYPNAGTGTFIAGSVIEEVGGETVEVARKIKKAYMGVGGVARPCWGGGDAVYYGTITPLNEAKTNLAGGTIGDYALFAGGTTGGVSNTTATVETYNTSLVKSTVSSLNQGRYNLATANAGNYLLFVGGTTRSSRPTTTADYYTSSLTKGMAPSLPGILSFGNGKGTALGNYGFIAGLDISYNYVYAYDSTLTIHELTNPSTSHSNGGVASVGEYALVVGGYATSKTKTNIVEVYNTSLTKLNNLSITVATANIVGSGTNNNTYALFAGGDINTSATLATMTSTVYCFNSSLSLLTSPSLSSAKESMGAVNIEDTIIFAGGWNQTAYDPVNTVDVYTDSLTRQSPPPDNLSVARLYMGCATVGGYGIFAGGGQTGLTALTANVDVYTL